MTEQTELEKAIEWLKKKLKDKFVRDVRQVIWFVSQRKHVPTKDMDEYIWNTLKHYIEKPPQPPIQPKPPQLREGRVMLRGKIYQIVPLDITE